MSRLKLLGVTVISAALVVSAAHGYLLQNSLFDDPITWDDGEGWERFDFGGGVAATQEDWASGSPGDPPGVFGAEGDGNLGIAHRSDSSTGGGFVQVVPGIIAGADYFLEIHSHAGSDSAGGDNYPTTSVFNIDMEFYIGDPDDGGLLVTNLATVVDPTDGGSDGDFPPGYSDPGNWDYWFITNTAPAGADTMRLTIKWDGFGTNAVGSSGAVRWDNALLTTSAESPINDVAGLGEALRLSYNTETGVTYDVESTTDLPAGFGPTTLPQVNGDDLDQEVFFVGDQDADNFRLKVVETPIDISNLTIVPWNSVPNWLGYMNVFDLPANGGAFQFGSAWGVGDLVSDIESTVSNNVLTLEVNQIGDPDPYWYIGGGGPGAQGNKIMDANLYREFPGGEYDGATVTFNGTVLANTVSNTHAVTAFIRDFAPGYGSFNDATTNLTPGPFSITLTVDPGPGRIVQYGFNFNGPNVWFTDAAAFGNVQLSVDTGFVPAPVDTDLERAEGNVLTWDDQEGVNFQPQYSDNGGGTWSDLGPVIQGDGGTASIADYEGPVGGRIYRAIRTPTATP